MKNKTRSKRIELSRKRVEIEGKIESFSLGDRDHIEILINKASIAEWLAIFCVIEMDLGSVLVVPGAGEKCRVETLESRVRLNKVADIFELALDINSFGAIRSFLAAYYYNDGSIVNHIDIEIEVAENPGGYLVIKVAD